MARPSEPPRALRERLYLYGVRSVIIIVALVALGSILTVHGWLVGRMDYIASGVLIVVIGLTVGFASMRTSYTMITKRYFAAESLVGKTGRAEASFQAQAKGAVHVEHETWSAVSEEDISRGDQVVVTAVNSDKATLRVRKQNL